MAALAPNHYSLVYQNGASDKAALYALRDVSTGDTADLAQDFLALKQAVMLGTTVNGSAVASVSGTVVTMPSGLSSDAAYLLAWGDSA
jgi:hypothetical protein